MFETQRGLVLRGVRYKEADRILTVLSEDKGKITIKGRGCLRKGSHASAACQDLCYSEFNVFANRGMNTADEAVVIEEFYGLRSDIANFSLGMYIASVLDAVCAEELPDSQALSLGLNALYALSNNLYRPDHIKSVFELRLMSIEGFYPDLGSCALCGKEYPQYPEFSLEEGKLYCRDCARMEKIVTASMNEGVLKAMRYILKADSKKIYNFTLEEDSARILHHITESFLLLHMERSFSTLDYWKKVK